MEKEIFDRGVLAGRYRDFAEHFRQGDILILEDGNKRIVRFPNTSVFRPKWPFVELLINDFFPEYKLIQREVSGCLPLGVEVIIDTNPLEKKE